LFGVLNLNKPPGESSRQTVDRVARLVRPDKAGHAGTLDPLASGVLLVMVGQATRLVEYCHRLTKTYRATFLLDRRSPTDDVEGPVETVAGARVPDLVELLGAAATLVGSVLQRPPPFSALKVGGRRAYRLARAGQEVELAARPVRIERIEVVRYEFPEVEAEIACGAGTYIRSVGRDLAERVGTCAVMSGLVRTGIGPFHVEDAVSPEILARDSVRSFLLPPLDVLGDMPAVSLSDEEATRVERGQFIGRPDRAEEDELAAVAPDGRLLAILRQKEPGILAPLRVFPREEPR
jgi:tRNA pseudouridine55 synthase